MWMAEAEAIFFFSQGSQFPIINWYHISVVFTGAGGFTPYQRKRAYLYEYKYRFSL